MPLDLATRNRLDALIGRCTYDEEFVSAFRSDPQATLQESELIVNPERMEQLISEEPATFDQIAEAMTRVLGDDFWARAGAIASTCDDVEY